MKILHSILLIIFSFVSVHYSAAEDLAVQQRDFSQFEETSEYERTPKSTGVLKRWWVYKHTDSRVLVPCSSDVDERREAILDAIWSEDEEAFTRLAKSPTTGKGGLQNQKFSKIVSELKKMDRWPLRTMRSHPVMPADPTIVATITSFHQLMTLPAEDKTPRRGNINLIFRKDDWTLAFVRVNWFDDDRVNLLPRPDSSIGDDPVVDRGVPAEEKPYRPE